MTIRVPHIPNYNTAVDIEASVYELEKLGCRRFEHLNYVLPDQLTVYHNKERHNTKRPYGKDTCAVLKAIRQLIADKNDIPFSPHVCTHDGDVPVPVLYAKWK